MATDRHKIQRRFSYLAVGLVVIVLGLGAWLVGRAVVIRDNLAVVATSLPELQELILAGDTHTAPELGKRLEQHSLAARDAASDPIWKASRVLPWVGANLAAASEVTVAVNDILDHAVMPLLSDPALMNFEPLIPDTGALEVEKVKQAAPRLSASANLVRLSYERLDRIDRSALMPDLADTVRTGADQVKELSTRLQVAADTAQVLPSMAGADAPRHYLLLVQNNAEVRATGGIPGALAILTLHEGEMTLDSQTSASETDPFRPPVPVAEEQTKIFSDRLGTFIQDVNLTPDFPTAASTAHAMWEENTGVQLDGVVSVDPVALGYVLAATGPIALSGPATVHSANVGLPTVLTGENIVHTLISDVYTKFDRPVLQDAYFAVVAREVFGALSNGSGSPNAILDGLSRGASERRILLWSANKPEQSVIANYPLSGSVSGASVSPAQFGVYFNDGTGAKMDYYVKRKVQLVKKCAVDGYEQTAVRITSTNTAPADAATSLPSYVTGAGTFGVSAGSVRTNVIGYGPVQANVETAFVDGKKTDFAAQRHSDRPVGAVTVTLAPGQTSTVELTFGKIVQHTEPNVVVTPTVQPVKDVILATEEAVCNQ